MQPLVPLVFHNLPSLYPPSFRRNDFYPDDVVRMRIQLHKNINGYTTNYDALSFSSVPGRVTHQPDMDTGFELN